MMNTYAPALQWIESQKGPLLQDLMNWSSINSHVFNPEGQEIQKKAIIQKLASLACTVVHIPLPPFQHMEETGDIITIPVVDALMASKRPQAPIQVILSGHLDTVFPRRSTFQNASMITDTLLQGPGVADMKGGLLVAILALEALEQTDAASSIGWKLVINPDEEIGSPSSESWLKQIASQAQYALVFEPAFADGALVSKRAGSLNLAIVAKGVAAHAGRDFDKGRSALFAMAQLISDIQKMPRPKSVTINAGSFHSGHAYNIVPDLAVCKINVRAETGANLTQTYASIKQRIDMHSHVEGITFTAHEISKRLPMESVDKTLLATLAECAQALGIEVKTRPSRGVSDANILADAGVRTLDTLGPIGMDLHTEKEALYIPSLIDRAKLAFLLLTKLAKRM